MHGEGRSAREKEVRTERSIGKKRGGKISLFKVGTERFTLLPLKKLNDRGRVVGTKRGKRERSLQPA